MKDLGIFCKSLEKKNIFINKNKLFFILRQKEYLYDTKDKWNQPKQEFIKNGLFKSIEKKHNERIYRQTFIFKKGAKIIFKMLKEMKYKNEEYEKKYSMNDVYKIIKNINRKKIMKGLINETR